LVKDTRASLRPHGPNHNHCQHSDIPGPYKVEPKRTLFTTNMYEQWIRFSHKSANVEDMTGASFNQQYEEKVLVELW